MKQKLKKHLIPLIFLIIVSLFATKALFKPGFYTSHDGEHQLARLYVFDRALKAKHFPPRFDRQLQNNLGYPLFTYTYQLPFWIGHLFVSLGASIPQAVKFTFIFGLLASAITMYIFTQEKWGKTAAFLAAFLYIWVPSRFLIIFVRASLGEHIALVFVPLILWSINSVNKPKFRIAIGGLSIACLFLSHMMLAQIALIPIAFYWIARLIQEKNKIQFVKHTLLVILLALGLAAFYLIPALYYQDAIQGLNRTFFADHFVTLKQLIYSPWGYGFSVLGPNDGLSFQVGIAQWLVIPLAFIVLLNQKQKQNRLVILSLLICFVLTIFLMTQSASEIWRHAVSRWVIIDIPWRLLAATSISAAILSALVISSIKFKTIKLILFTGLIFTALYTNRNHLRVNKYLNIDSSWFTNYKGTSNSYDEYKPVDTHKSFLVQDNLPAIQSSDPDAQINILSNLPHRLQAQITLSQPATVNIHTVYFPGFKLYLNHQLVDIKSTLINGVPQLNLTQGQHLVKLDYQQTSVMKFANLISLLSLLILIIILCQRKNQK